MLGMQPHAQDTLVLARMILVSGLLPYRSDISGQHGQRGPPPHIQELLVRVNLPPFQPVKQDEFRRRHVPGQVRGTLIGNPPGQRTLSAAGSTFREPLLGSMEIQCLIEPSPSGSSGAVRTTARQSSLMGRQQPRSILLANVQMEADCRHDLAAAVRKFPHGQPRGVHHVPFRMPRHVPTRHGSKLRESIANESWKPEKT